MSKTTLVSGLGDGKEAGVTRANRLMTHSVAEREAEFINSHDQQSYIMYMDTTPTAAGDFFCYMKNTHDTKDLEISWYRIWTESSPEAIDVYVNLTGTPAGTTALTPSNAYVGNGNTATGEFYEGADITGLSGGTLFDRLRISGDGKDVVDEFPQKVIMPQGTSIAFLAVNGAIPVELTVAFHYKSRD